MQENTKIDPELFPDVERGDWDVEQVSEESSNKPSDEIVREMLRGDETKGDADERDVVGGVESADTPHGREETKEN
ncbi:MAG: hypothetical protein H0W58_14975 [Acidobacteria bacterium]|jgi:hypothetical protein|nr:hypothetical protein [Acidobacteriota bacterium]